MGKRNGPVRAKPKSKQQYDSLDAIEAAMLQWPSLCGGAVTQYEYPTFTMLRFDFDDDRSKEFRPVHSDEGKWVVGKPDDKTPLYRRDEAFEHNTVFVVEGEACAGALWDIGLAAVTSAHGSSSPQNTDWEPLAGKNVVILPDHDAPGIKYARTVAKILTDRGCTV